jgi:hypothetical protein
VSDLRQRVTVSAVVAVAVELGARTIAGLASPAGQVAHRVAALPAPTVSRLLVLVGFAVLVAANSVVAGQRVADEDAPVVGRAAAGLMVGLPLAVLEAAVIAVVWLLGRPG